MARTLRPARWPADEPGLAALDYSYTTDRVYRLRRDALSFQFTVETLASPLYKVYPSLESELPRLRATEHVMIAEAGGEVTGMVAANLEKWNRRVRVEYVVVAPAVRGRGIGRALMDSVVAFARDRGAWCVWLETQADNSPAIAFYRRLGFRLCGLDECLYDPASPAAGDLAVFFALELAPQAGRQSPSLTA
jgi:ribosomal protein S18 acetylase RimI-like enzyme